MVSGNFYHLHVLCQSYYCLSVGAKIMVSKVTIQQYNLYETPLVLDLRANVREY